MIGIAEVDPPCEIRMRAERCLGEMLKESKKNKGGRPSKNPSTQGDGLSPKTLNELGISRDQSSQYQQMAELPPREFEKRLDYVTRDPRRASTEKLLKPIPTTAPEPEWSARKNIWTETMGWFSGSAGLLTLQDGGFDVEDIRPDEHFFPVRQPWTCDDHRRQCFADPHKVCDLIAWLHVVLPMIGAIPFKVPPTTHHSYTPDHRGVVIY